MPEQYKSRAVDIGDDENPIKPTKEQLDEDEAMLRALRIDLPGTADAPTGIVSISATEKMPRREFFRTHSDPPIAMFLVDHSAGMDKEFYAVLPAMVGELASIGVDALPYRLYQVLTADGALKIILCRQAGVDGSQNEWNRTREIALVRGQKVWVRVISDKANTRYRIFEAPPNRFPEPLFPPYTWAQLIKLSFTDRGRLIDSAQHPLFKKWAGSDGADG
jgi:hypothetical protein